MKKYRRIEINAYHRKVTVVSGEWRRDDVFEGQPTETEGGVSLAESDSSEPVAADSPEGQLILVEAVRSLEQRLSPEARALLYLGQNTVAPKSSILQRFYSWFQSFFRPNEPHLPVSCEETTD